MPNNDSKPFGQIIMAAPDVDPEVFRYNFSPLEKYSDSFSLYYCTEDMALLASKKVHEALKKLHKESESDSKKLARLGAGPFFAPGLDNIAADKANTSKIGHNYYASETELIIDLGLLINRGFEPPKRVELGVLEENRMLDRLQRQHVYWEFP